MNQLFTSPPELLIPQAAVVAAIAALETFSDMDFPTDPYAFGTAQGRATEASWALANAMQTAKRAAEMEARAEA